MRNTKRRSARSKNNGRSSWGPTAARRRATARGQRKRGEFALKRRTAIIAGLFLFLAGLAAGSVAGVVADRRGLVDQAGLAPAADALSAGLTVAADYALALVESETAAPSETGDTAVAAAPASTETPEASFEADYEPSFGPNVAAIDPWQDREIAELRLTGATEAESVGLREERIKPLPFQLLRVVADETASQENATPPDQETADQATAGRVQLADLSMGSRVESEDTAAAGEPDPMPLPKPAPRWSDGPTLTDLVEAVLKEGAGEGAAGTGAVHRAQTAKRESPTIIPNPFHYETPPTESPARTEPADATPVGPDVSKQTDSEFARGDAPAEPAPVADTKAAQAPESFAAEAGTAPDLDADASHMVLYDELENVTVERTDPAALELADGGVDGSPGPATEGTMAPADSESVAAAVADEFEPEAVAADAADAPESADAETVVATVSNGPAAGARDAAEIWTKDVASTFERKASDNAPVMANLDLANGPPVATENGDAVAKQLAPGVPPSVIHLIYQEPLQEQLAALPPSEREVERVIQEAGLITGVPDQAANGGGQPWLQNAARSLGAENGPMIALVIDDLGLNRPKTRDAIALPGPMTLSFLTYAKNLDLMVSQARTAGHEIMVHMPMEPRDKKYDPGPGALRVGMSPGELEARIDWGLSRFDGYVGVNNHMGSKLTSSLPEMALVIKAVKERGLLFLDSVTAGSSVAERLAERMAVPYAERDLFLDHGDFTYASIRHQLKALETIAARRGYAVGIGHPHGPTLEALADWLPTLEERGITLVPISAIVRHRIELATANGNAG